MRRVIDVLGSLVLLLLLAPFLAVAALAIVLDSGRPVFFRQERVGRDGRLFRMWKFRTMRPASRAAAEDSMSAEDARITRVGRWMRAWSIDELPQLLNILSGEMSFIGPRPTLRDQVERYTEHQRRRLEVRPGVTGWAQVNGRNTLPWSERIELDIWYVDHRSFMLDMRILARTVRVALGREGVYGEDGVNRGLDG